MNDMQKFVEEFEESDLLDKAETITHTRYVQSMGQDVFLVVLDVFDPDMGIDEDCIVCMWVISEKQWRGTPEHAGTLSECLLHVVSAAGG